MARTLVLQGANVIAFGSLWVAQFFILDRVVFRAPAIQPGRLYPDTRGTPA